ncbi:ABC transporter permease [Virgibacillus salarius]|uniref:ABC transporter permease n=1 Tax=Virgibacillus salarius TaxID=447199 RepID=UPI0003FC084B|nr:ABC transporter permease [Priestia megaterium]
MNSFRIAFKLMRNNSNIYGLYFLVLVVTVATYYNFAAIQYNDKFVELTERVQSAVVASFASGFVLICTVVFFMWHANSFFIKQRQKEIGLYMLMGISNARIGRVLALEGLFIGGLAFTVGLIIGILFSKLFFMLLSKAMFLDVVLPFNISIEAIIQLILVFGVIFILLGIKNYSAIKKKQLIDMLHATIEKPAKPKYSLPKGILSIFLIVAGYFIALNIKPWQLDLLLAAVAIVFLVSLGTYLFFGSSLTVILSNLIKTKRFIYKDVRLISISSIFFRLKENYRSLAMTAILAAATVTAFSVSISFNQFANSHEVIETPYSFSVESESPDTNELVREAVESSEHSLKGVHDLHFFIGKVHYDDSRNEVDKNNEAIITSYSQMEKTLEYLQYKGRDNLLDQIKPSQNEATFILNPNTIASPMNILGDKMKINKTDFQIAEFTQVPFIGNNSKYGRMNVYVLQDQDYERHVQDFEELTLTGVDITNQENSSELISNIKQIIPNGEQMLYENPKQYIWEYYALGTLFFLGLIISIVFMLATFSTIYFKFLSDAFSDKEQYAMLKKVGMSRKEVQRSVNLTVGIAFLIPIIIGIVHSVVAMKVLEQIMSVKFTFPLLLGVGWFVFVMTFFYKGIIRSYTNMVYKD